MTDDLLDRLARRSRVRRALGFAAIAAVILLSVLGRSVTEPAPRGALSAAGLAQPVGPAGPSATPGAPAAARPRQHRRTAVTSPAPRRTPSTAPHAGTAHSAPSHTAAPRPATTTTHAAASVRRTITGAAYDVSYGTVQVRVTFSGSTITDVTAVSLPQGGRSSDISAMAAPQLRREALAAQSSNIDAVSGASYTSAGYARSLQSAIDQSHR